VIPHGRLRLIRALVAKAKLLPTLIDVAANGGISLRDQPARHVDHVVAGGVRRGRLHRSVHLNALFLSDWRSRI
jgi:hypothetical protein